MMLAGKSDREIAKLADVARGGRKLPPEGHPAPVASGAQD
jgi:hypothetical protein